MAEINSPEPSTSLLGGGEPTQGAPEPTPTPTPAAANPTASNGKWYEALPKEMQENDTLKKFTSVEALAGSYLSAQKMIGAAKIAVPTKHTTPEEWGGIYKALGLPEKIEDYVINTGEYMKDEAFVADFKGALHKAGVLPHQAQAISDFFNSKSAEQIKAQGELAHKTHTDNVNELKKEWGNSFDLNINRAKKVLSEVGGEETLQYFQTSALGADPKLIKVLAKIGEEFYKEHKFVDGQGTAAGMSPQELDKKIAELQANPAYLDKLHPSHKSVLAEVTDLYKQKFPIDKK